MSIDKLVNALNAFLKTSKTIVKKQTIQYLGNILSVFYRPIDSHMAPNIF